MQYTATLERAWYELCHSLDVGLSAYDLLVTGGCTAVKRATAFTAFREDPSAYVLLLSTQSNAAGLTLTAANNLIVLDVPLNLEDELQLLHRIHRIGQTRAVNIYRWVSPPRGTVARLADADNHRMAIKGSLEERILQRREQDHFKVDPVSYRS